MVSKKFEFLRSLLLREEKEAWCQPGGQLVSQEAMSPGSDNLPDHWAEPHYDQRCLAMRTLALCEPKPPVRTLFLELP